MMFRFGRPRPMWVAVALAALGCLIGAYIYRARGPQLSQPGPAAKPLSRRRSDAGADAGRGAAIHRRERRRDLRRHAASRSPRALRRDVRNGRSVAAGARGRRVRARRLAGAADAAVAHVALHGPVPSAPRRARQRRVRARTRTPRPWRNVSWQRATRPRHSCRPTFSIPVGASARATRRTTISSTTRGSRTGALTDVERPAGPVVDAALAWLRQPRRAERPFYLWVHLYDPHRPYEPPDGVPAQGARRRTPARSCTPMRRSSRLLDALDALGLRRNTLVVYLSDHGESLGDHGEPTHGIFLYGATLDVPLIIAPPSGGRARLAGRRPRRPARARPGATRRRHADGARPRRAACAIRSRRRQPAAHGGARSARRRVRRPPRIRQTRSPVPCRTRRPITRGSTTTGASSSLSRRQRWKYVRAPRPELYDLAQGSRRSFTT